MKVTISGTYNLPVLPEFRNIQQQDIYLFCDTSQADVNIYLPSVSDWNGFWNAKIYISDMSNNSYAHPIFIHAGGDDTINQLPYEAVNSNGASCNIVITGSKNWLCTHTFDAPQEYEKVQNFVPANNQTIFSLTDQPAQVQEAKVFINGMLQRLYNDYTITGKILQYLNNGFALEATDNLTIYYI